MTQPSDMGYEMGPAFAVLGAHGGAGTSTVTAWLDHCRERVIELTQGSSLPMGHVPVVVARSTAAGLQSAGHLLGSWHPHVPRPYLLVVRDAPLRVPRKATYRQRALGSRTLGVLEVPYLYRLRETDGPSDGLRLPEVSRAAWTLRNKLTGENKK